MKKKERRWRKATLFNVWEFQKWWRNLSLELRQKKTFLSLGDKEFFCSFKRISSRTISWHSIFSQKWWKNKKGRTILKTSFLFSFGSISLFRFLSLRSKHKQLDDYQETLHSLLNDIPKECSTFVAKKQLWHW